MLPTEYYQPPAAKPQDQTEYGQYTGVPPSELDDSPRTPQELAGYNIQRE